MTASATQDDFDQADFALKRDTSNHAFNQFLVCGSLFECPVKYVPIKPIGKGAYGIVCSAKNIENDEPVAIKKIISAFDNSIDAKRTLREIRLLRHLKHENVIQIKDILPPVSHASFKDVYVVYELMDTDLHQIIKSPQPLSEEHVQYFLYQVLRGLKYIHSAKVLHRDIKPSNLLVNANCDLKICDFGLARTSVVSKQQEFMTEYVVTRWYRGPELLLSCQDYDCAIDVWSVGCVLAELIGRKPLFPGKDYVQQLNFITKVIGSPTEADLDFISSDKAKRYLRSLPHFERARFSAMWPQTSPQLLNLLDRMLVFNPRGRITVDEALAHPFLASLHDESDEPIAEVPFVSMHEGEDITPETVKVAILDDVADFYPELVSNLRASTERPASGTKASPPATPGLVAPAATRASLD